jgi:indole-3-glycerol phosphate synthase
VIAEIKRASPSKGTIAETFEPVAQAQRYKRGGAAAVSVVTEERSFKGSLDYLVDIRDATGLPVLRKDFIIDTVQVEQSAWVNADALLLIAAALSDAQLDELLQAAAELKVEPLVEIHNFRELERVLKLDIPILGINNRNLHTFDVDLETTFSLIREIPDTIPVVSESGITSGEHAEAVYKAGVCAILVGESLMRSDSPETLIEELCNAGTR